MNPKMKALIDKVKFSTHGFGRNRHREVTMRMEDFVVKFVEVPQHTIEYSGFVPGCEVWAMHSSVRMSEEMVRALAAVDGVSAIAATLGGYWVLSQISPVYSTRWVIVHAAAAMFGYRHTSLSTLPMSGLDGEQDDGCQDDTD